MDDNTEIVETENAQEDTSCVDTSADEKEEIHRQTEHQIGNHENVEDEPSDTENKMRTTTI